MDTSTLPSPAPRLAPIDRPPTLLARLLWWLYRRMLGRVIMPARVLFTRMPRLVLPTMLMYRLLENRTSLDPVLVELVQLRVSLRNGCSFCSDLHRYVAEQRGRSQSLLAALVEEQPAGLSPAFSAALAYVDAIRADGAPSDQAFAELRRHFDERAVVELTWLAAFTGYLNAMAKAVGIGSEGFCAAQRVG